MPLRKAGHCLISPQPEMKRLPYLLPSVHTLLLIHAIRRPTAQVRCLRAGFRGRGRDATGAVSRLEGRGLVTRKLDLKRETLIVLRGPDTPAMRLHDRAADRQPDPQPPRLGADEVLEDSLQLRGFDPDSAVTDRDGDAPHHGLAGVDPDLAWAVRGEGSGLCSVDDEVQDDLSELNGGSPGKAPSPRR
jgi:hypothetical protein